MATLRIDNEDDELLEKIRAQYILKGIKKSKKDIIKELINKKAQEIHELLLLENPDEFYEEDYAWKMLDKPLDWGVSDTSKTVDYYLYRRKK